MIVLGIESSCDETSVAVYSSEKGTLCSRTFSQADIHATHTTSSSKDIFMTDG